MQKKKKKKSESGVLVLGSVLVLVRLVFLLFLAFVLLAASAHARSLPACPPPSRRQNSVQDEPRSPLAHRPLFDWEKSLVKHVNGELSIRWSTSSEEAAAAATAAARPTLSGAVGDNVEGGGGRGGGGVGVVGGGGWTSGRRGRLKVPLAQIEDDGCCAPLDGVGVGTGGRGGNNGSGGGSGGGGGGGGSRCGVKSLQPKNPEAVPECLLGALLPPVRLSCLPLAFTPPKGGGGHPMGAGLVDVEGFATFGISEAGEVEVGAGVGVGVEGQEESGGMHALEGGWAVSVG